MKQPEGQVLIAYHHIKTWQTVIYEALYFYLCEQEPKKKTGDDNSALKLQKGNARESNGEAPART